ncbi:MAG TPA: ceramidase domain-containing protein [Hyphomicrobiaceae bacterium]|nr:ceramidase domain-containing protein [Hyphomicrobiaceae bacterium]
MSAQIFAYCERGTDPGFWAEPLNALSNAAFLVAALLAWWLWRQRQPDARRAVDLALVVLVAAIGTGSFLFHTFATRWAAIADVLPITVFMLAYMAYALRRFLVLPWIWVAGGLAVFMAALSSAEWLVCGGSGRCFNGSAGYFPAVAALAVMGVWLSVRRHPAAVSLIWAGGLLALSLIFRTIDWSVCEQTRFLTASPWGTHFIWHLANGTLLYVLLRAAIVHGEAKMR